MDDGFTYCDLVLQYLQKHGSITSMDAIRHFGCTRLAAYISELKSRGVKIRTEIEIKKARSGRTQRWARYYLEVEDVGS